MQNVLGKARARIAHRQAHAPCGRPPLGLDQHRFAARAIGLLLRVLRILQQVVNHLAQLLRIGQHGLAIRVQLGVHGHLGVFGTVELQHIANQGIHIQRQKVRSWQARVIAKFVNQPLHGVHLIDDGAHRTRQYLLLFGRQVGHELHFQPLGR